MKEKKIYRQPETTVTRVELESPICGGSVDMTAQTPTGTETQAQEVNTAFNGENDFKNDTWDNPQ